jgi:hypothetical protein
MKRLMLLTAAASIVGFVSNPSVAKDLPGGGMTAKEIASWLVDAGYKGEIQTNKDGSTSVASATDGGNFYIDMNDCNDGVRCAAIEFYAGFKTKGAWNAAKMNDWNRDRRWVRAHVDDNNDPWLQMDVDLSPGGTQEGLDDQFALWRDRLSKFKTYINW